MSTIQVLKPKFHIDECLEQVRQCLEKGWTGSGFKTAELETKWKEYTGHANACFLNSNTSGLHLAFNILKRHGLWQDGDEVITTPITFVATNHAILPPKPAPLPSLATAVVWVSWRRSSRFAASTICVWFWTLPIWPVPA